MFKTLSPSLAVLYSSCIIIFCLLIAITIQGIKKKRTIITTALYVVIGIYTGNLLTIAAAMNTALSYGETPDAFSYNDLLIYNRHTIPETKTTLDEIKGCSVVFIRYGCPDCLELHDELLSMENVIFLSSRSELGKKVRETYNINLTEVPQGAYVDKNGNSILINIVSRQNDTISLDQHQVKLLNEMAIRSIILSDK